VRKARLQPDQWEKSAAGEQRTAVYGHVMASFHKAAPRCIFTYRVPISSIDVPANTSHFCEWCGHPYAFMASPVNSRKRIFASERPFLPRRVAR
jgi:hypothetical protein